MLEDIKEKIDQKIEEHKEKKEEKEEDLKKEKLEKKIEEVKKIGIEEVINKKSITWKDRISKFFNKIDILELKQEEKAEVAVKVKNDASPDKLYWIEIFLSGIIASLGLLQNSVAVIIGAMLIAPFLRPINGIAFGIARGERKFFFTSLKVFFISAFVSIFMGYIVMNITGLYKETSEILARTSPNIIDLFIAIFSAMVALLSLRYKRLGESVAGVAMAASLMPPLGVIGMEIALQNYNLALGALMLFVANIIAIIIVGIGAFWLYGFTPNDGGKQKKSFIRIFSVLFLVGLISIPLLNNLAFIRDKEIIEKKLEKNISLLLHTKIDEFNIGEIKIKEINKNFVKIKLNLKIKEGVSFYNDFEEYLEKELSRKIGREVRVEIELTRILDIISKEEEELENKKKIENRKNLENKKNLEQKNYIDKIKKEFSEEFDKKLKEELEKKLKKEEELKKELEEKMKKEFDELLKEKIEEIKEKEKKDEIIKKEIKEK